MAFMMPVVKNDWDIYKSNRTRKTSECNTSSTVGRTRKISECRSEGQGTPPKIPEVPFKKHHSVPDRMSCRGFSRTRTCSEHLPNRVKSSIPPEKKVAASANNLKHQNSDGSSWLDKIRRFMKPDKNEEERSKS